MGNLRLNPVESTRKWLPGKSTERLGSERSKQSNNICSVESSSGCFFSTFILLVPCVVWFNLLGIHQKSRSYFCYEKPRKLSNQSNTSPLIDAVEGIMHPVCPCRHIIQPREWMEWSGNVSRWNCHEVKRRCCNLTCILEFINFSK